MSAATLNPVSPALEQARQNHARGRLLEAAQAYGAALESEPQSAAALLGLSLIARQSRQLPAALHMAQAALACGGAAGKLAGPAWANYGDSLAALHSLDEAEGAFRRAIAVDPLLAAAHYSLGNVFALQECFEAACESFARAAELAPGIAEMHFAHAFAQGKLGRHEGAIVGYRRAVELRPGFASAWLNLGVELVADGRVDLAELCYRQALGAASAEHPGTTSTRISAYLNVGHLERLRRDWANADRCYERALELTPAGHPRRAEVLVSYAYLHMEQREFAKAWERLSVAEDAQAGLPESNAEIANARGILLLAEADRPERMEAAIAAFEDAEARGHRTAVSNRGNALLRQGRCREALAAHAAAVEREPYHPGVRYNLALTQLRLGDYAQGWANYEIRWSFRDVHPQPRRYAQPRWRGEEIGDAGEGAALLVYGEQGFGDTIQFCRYLHRVAERLPRSRLVFEVQAPLTRLMRGFAAELTRSHAGLSAEVIAHGNALPGFTHHCPLMSLPAVFGTTLESVPVWTGPGGYLRADEDLAAERRRELEGWGSGQWPRVGIAWAGNPGYRADHERSTRLETFLPLLRIPGMQWIALQKGEAAGQIAAVHSLPEPECGLVDGSSQDGDFADTAALMASLDLVVSTDTAVAHLAGAMGKPVWLMLPWQSDWRWMQDRLDTPWYPSARLFRQSRAGDWAELVERVAEELRRFLRCWSAA